MGFEPTTFCLASRSSTPELHPRYKYLFEGYTMKNILLTFPFLLVSFNSFSAEPPGQVVRKPVVCFALDEGLNYLKSEYGETIKRKLGINKYFETEYSLLENEEKGTWTVLEYKDNIGCIVASGMGDKKV